MIDRAKVSAIAEEISAIVMPTSEIEWFSKCVRDSKRWKSLGPGHGPIRWDITCYHCGGTKDEFVDFWSYAVDPVCPRCRTVERISAGVIARNMLVASAPCSI